MRRTAICLATTTPGESRRVLESHVSAPSLCRRRLKSGPVATGIKFVLCKPGDPEAKGLVERANGYLETSFLPGRVFTSPADFNIQLADWLSKANRRVHRSLQARPADRVEADRSRMLSLPPIAPPGWWKASLRLPRDHYVRLDTCDYSVHPLAIGRRIEVAADLDQVLVTCDGVEVARHARSWARHQPASSGLVAKGLSSGILAARHRSRSSVQDLGRYSSRSTRARPLAEA